MRTIRYGVAASLDGYIAGPNGEYDWIPMDPDIDFGALMSRFDTFLMGRKTYEVWSGGGQGGGGDVAVWVFSRTLRPEEHPGVTIVGEGVVERLRELRERPGKEIALFGGGALFRSLLELGQVDAVEVAVLPVLLGGGIPLLPSPAVTRRLELRSHRVYAKTGTVLLDYAVRPESAKPASRSRRKGSRARQRN
jgi:dihydrofolate reductase